MIAIRSAADILTGKTGTVLRSLLISRGGFSPGPYEEDAAVHADPPGWWLQVRSTPANLLFFKNLCLSTVKGVKNIQGDLDVGVGGESVGDFEAGEDPCLGVARRLSKSGNPAYARVFPKYVPIALLNHPGQPWDVFVDPVFDPVPRLRVMFNCSADLDGAADSSLEFCKPASDSIAFDPSQNQKDLHIWNRTPYWMLDVDADVMNGHNDLWRAPMVNLLRGMILAMPVLTQEEVLPADLVPAAIDRKTDEKQKRQAAELAAKAAAQVRNR